MIICTICGAISTDDEAAETHYNRTHLGLDEPEDEFWLDMAKILPAELSDLGI